MSQSISALLKKYNLRPRKGLGQNFLTDRFHLSQIVEAAGLTSEDTVLEIGPGPGMLTGLLAEAAGQVIAVELDPAMVNLLQNEYSHLDNLTIIQGDILQIDIGDLITGHVKETPDSYLPQPPQQEPSPTPLPSPEAPAVDPSPDDPHTPSYLPEPTSPDSPASSYLPDPTSPAYKVVANLPYYITSAVLRHLLEATPRPRRVVVTVQKEVAHRIVAGPGQMSILAVSVQFYGDPKLVHHIPAGAFYPPPKVDSAVVRIDPFAQLPLDVEADHFFRVVKAGFSQKRKKLKNALAGGLHHPASRITAWLEQAQIDPARRAETLSLPEWGRLVEAIEL